MVSAKGLWLALWLALTVNAAEWTITSVFIQTITQYTYTGTYADRTETITSPYTRNTPVTLKPSVTITATPVSAHTTTSRFSDFDGHDYDGSDSIVYIDRFYPPGAIPASDLTSSVYLYNQSDYTATYFFQAVELTAPSSCPTPFTVTTTIQVPLPSELIDQVSIKSATTSIAILHNAGMDDYTNTYVSAYLASTSHPTGAAATRNYIYRAYMAGCTSPDPTQASYPEPTSDGKDASRDGANGGNDRTSSCDWGSCGNTRHWVVIVVMVLLAIFLFGFFESYYWFTCLMSGQGALRVGTISWILMCLPFIFLTRHVPARDAEDQKRLRAQWMEKKFAQKFSLWMRWGLRYRYPIELLGDHTKYRYGNPAEDEKLAGNWSGNQGAAVQMSMASPQTQSQTPQLPPQVRLAGLNKTSVLKESGSSAAPGEDKGKGVETKGRISDVQVGPAPKVEDDMKEHSNEAGTQEGEPRHKDNNP